MKEKIEALNDAQLLELADELTKTSLPTNSIVRNIIGPTDSIWQIRVIEVNCLLVQVLADRLKGCSPHLEK